MKLNESYSITQQTINECTLRSAEPGLAHSKGKPDVSSTTTNINVRFAMSYTMEVQIRFAEGGAEF
jgi:hypothetical protein